MSTFRAGDPVVIIDRKSRKYLRILAEGKTFNLRGGLLSAGDLIGRLPGCHLQTSIGETITVHPATLDEYVLLMPRGATIIPPKDIAFIVHWGDIGPGHLVVEAGAGSGALTLGLLRAIGPAGKVISFEVREDFAGRALKNITAWPEKLADRLELRLGDVREGLATLSSVDRLVLDLPEPWGVLPAASQALRPGALFIAYVPTIRQIDRLTLSLLDCPEFSPPEVAELICRPWVADRTRLRPYLIIPGHSGFILRSRRVQPSQPNEPLLQQK